MLLRLIQRLKFFLERLLLRGAHYQLLLIALIIAFISLAAGFLAYKMTSEFKLFQDSTWWAFLRLTDPGYLGDDNGLTLKTISTVVTVLGYVFFMGALIAIMTQWLNKTIKKLEMGLTPITRNGHILILGYTNRTPNIVKELIVASGRVKRFLRQIGSRQLNIVILAEEVTADLAHKLREELGSCWNPKQITFRSGTPLAIDHLRRVDFAHASVVISPGSDFCADPPDVVDTRTIKSLLTMSNHGEEGDDMLPLVVAEIFDTHKTSIVKSAYAGDIEIIASDAMISRLIAQNVRHKGLSRIYAELLSHNEGNEIYIKEFPEMAGKTFHDVAHAFPKAISLGVLRAENSKLLPLLNPPAHFTIKENDRMVFIARKYMDIELNSSDTLMKMQRKNGPEISSEVFSLKKLLFLGWNSKAPVLIQEFLSYTHERFQIDILSLVPVSERDSEIKRFHEDFETIKLHHIQGDYISNIDMKRINPGGYDNIVFLANSWMGSHEESDARTILGYLLLREMLSDDTGKPEILIELMDPENEKLFRQRTGEVLISPVILSHILAQVALKRDLNVVFDELFTVGGAEIYFKPVNGFDLLNRELTFNEIEKIVFTYGDIAIGVRVEKLRNDTNGGIQLNPPKDTAYHFMESDDIVVLSTYI